MKKKDVWRAREKKIEEKKENKTKKWKGREKKMEQTKKKNEYEKGENNKEK